MNCNDNTDTLATTDLFGPTLVELVPALCAEAAARDSAHARAARQHQAAARQQAFQARLAAAQVPAAYEEHMRTASYYDDRAREFGDEARHWQRAANAYANAGQRWAEGWRPAPLPARRGWTMRSQRAGEPAHVLTYGDDRALTCSCRAGASAHWALMLIIAIEEAQEALTTLDDGDAADDRAGDPWPPDDGFVGPFDPAAWPIAPPATVPVDAWVWN